MATTGTVTSSQGALTLGTTPLDTITFTPSSATYTVEYPLGTVAIAASTSAQTLTLTNGGQMRILCVSGSVAYSLTDNPDDYTLTQSQTASVQALVSEDVIVARNRTWATLEAPADYIGLAYVTDVGLSGSLWRSDGATWGLVNGSVVLARGNTDLTVTAASTAEVDIASFDVPAGLIGTNGMLEVTHFWEATNNANVKTMRVKLGGTAFFANAAALNSSAIFLPPITRIWNRNSQSVQMAFAAANGNTTIATGTAKTTGAVDTSAATTLAISGQKATGSDTLTLLGYSVRLVRP